MENEIIVNGITYVKKKEKFDVGDKVKMIEPEDGEFPRGIGTVLSYNANIKSYNVSFEGFDGCNGGNIWNVYENNLYKVVEEVLHYLNPLKPKNGWVKSRRKTIEEYNEVINCHLTQIANTEYYSDETEKGNLMFLYQMMVPK